jgi:hypothetical protein
MRQREGRWHDEADKGKKCMNEALEHNSALPSYPWWSAGQAKRFRADETGI